MKIQYQNQQLNDLSEELSAQDLYYYEDRLDLIDYSILYRLMQASIDRVIDAINNEKHILVFGHDDADGISSAFILYHFLKRFCHKVNYYIPNRMIESHGIQENVVNYAIKNEVSLFISLDNGLTSVEGVRRLKSHQIDTLILDHHLIPAELPQAFHIFNPKLYSELDYFNPLAGVGITYLFVKCLSERLGQKQDPMDLFWTVVGTITDRVPLTKINRLLIKDFLRNKALISDQILIRKLASVFNIDAFASDHSMLAFIDQISSLFYFGRANEGEHLCFSMLIESDQKQDDIIQRLLQLKQENEQLIRYNESIIQQKVVQEILKNRDHSKAVFLNNQLLLIYKKSDLSFIAYIDRSDELSYPLIGRFAGQLSQQFSCPVMIIIPKEDHLAAEIRCLDGFHSLDFLNQHSSYFLNYGGHIKASGFSMQSDQLDRFLASVKEYIMALDFVQIKSTDQIITITYQSGVFEELLSFYKAQMPYGEMNHVPVFEVKSCFLNRDSMDAFQPQDRNSLHIQDEIEKKQQISADLIISYGLKSHHLIIKSYSIE